MGETHFSGNWDLLVRSVRESYEATRECSYTSLYLDVSDYPKLGYKIFHRHSKCFIDHPEDGLMLTLMITRKALYFNLKRLRQYNLRDELKCQN